MSDPQKYDPKTNRPVEAARTTLMPPAIGAILSIIPGLGQMVTGRFTRGFLLLFVIASILSLSYWRLDEAELDVEFFPPSITAPDGSFSAAQSETFSYAIVAIILTLLVYLWNIYDGYRCFGGKAAPSRLPFALLLVATLSIGSQITELDIGKAIRERSDIVPRLEQILFPWDDMWEYDKETVEAIGEFEVPCDDTPIPVSEPSDEPYIILDPTCGEESGLRDTSGNREEGTTVTVQGFNFNPNEVAELYLKVESIPERRVREEGEFVTVTADDDGEFTFSFILPDLNIPSTAVGSIPTEIRIRQEQNVGNPYPNEEFYLALDGIIVTLFLALMATAAGLVLAVPLSFFAARNLMASNAATRAIYYAVRIVMNVIRSIEPLIWALIAIAWIGPGPFAGVIALTVHTIAALGKLYSESIENINDGPIEAIQATGANRLQTIIYAVVPQIIPPFVSFTIYRWDINVRMSTIIGAVGGGGIGVVLIQWIRLGDYDAVGIAVWMIAIVVTILDYISARIREHYI